jgi:hypothetical protein
MAIFAYPPFTEKASIICRDVLINIHSFQTENEHFAPFLHLLMTHHVFLALHHIYLIVDSVFTFGSAR